MNVMCDLERKGGKVQQPMQEHHLLIRVTAGQTDRQTGRSPHETDGNFNYFGVTLLH